MKITLITACYNSAKTIKTAMDSVLAQKGVEIEYIVVDGGSTDGTVDIIREYSTRSTRSTRFKYISEPDNGMYDAINKGIKMATGDVVGILNADDMFESENTLAHVVEGFGRVDRVDGEGVGSRVERVDRVDGEGVGSRVERVETCREGKMGNGVERVEGEGVDAVYADVRFVKDDLEATVRYYSAKHWKPWMLQWGKMPPHPSVYIRRELFDKLGLYKLGYDIAADYELLIRYLRKAGIKARYMNECVVRMRMGGKSTRGWRSFVTLNTEIARANRENGYFCCFPMLLPKYLFKVFEFILPKLGMK